MPDATIGAPWPSVFAGHFRSDANGVTTLTFHGSATPAGVATLFGQFTRTPTPRLLWDLRVCDLADYPLSSLQCIVDQLMRLDTVGSRPRVERSAFVCSSEADAIVMRRLVTYAETRGYTIRLALFRDIGVARGWLADA